MYSVNFDGSNIRTVLTNAVHSVQNVAVDWINFKLYVLETRVERIDACDFDGGNRVTLVAENLHTPYGLALDPTVGSVLGWGGRAEGEGGGTLTGTHMALVGCSELIVNGVHTNVPTW